MRISDWSSDVCSSDLDELRAGARRDDSDGGAPDRVRAVRPALSVSRTGRAFRRAPRGFRARSPYPRRLSDRRHPARVSSAAACPGAFGHRPGDAATRSEEHTSEVQSLMRTSLAVFCWNNKNTETTVTTP